MVSSRVSVRVILESIRYHGSNIIIEIKIKKDNNKKRLGGGLIELDLGI